MAMKSISELVDELRAALTAYGAVIPGDGNSSNTILEMEVKSAIGIINRCRRFTPTEQKLYDIKYEDKIIPLAVAGFMKTGAEGETSHNENGVSRSYSGGGKYPKEMLSDIVPLAKFQ